MSIPPPIVAGRRGLDLCSYQLYLAGGAGRAGGLAASFPEAFRVRMAARADKLRDYGPNDPEKWEVPSAPDRSISASAYSATPKKPGATRWRQHDNNIRGASSTRPRGSSQLPLSIRRTSKSRPRSSCTAAKAVGASEFAPVPTDHGSTRRVPSRSFRAEDRDFRSRPTTDRAGSGTAGGMRKLS